MIQTLCQCKARVYVDSETGKKFDHDSSEYPHHCKPNPISLYQLVNGVPVRHSENWIAKLVTDEQLRLGLPLDRPYRRTYRGDNLFIS